jgi:hypothetical protein
MIPMWAVSALAAERYALISSASSGGPERVRLRHTHADAERMASVLLEVGGLQPARLVRLTEPGVDEVRQALQRLSAELEPMTEPAAQRKGGRPPVRAFLGGLAMAGFAAAGTSWSAYVLMDSEEMHSDRQAGNAPLHAFYFGGALGVLSTTTLLVLPREAR